MCDLQAGTSHGPRLFSEQECTSTDERGARKYICVCSAYTVILFSSSPSLSFLQLCTPPSFLRLDLSLSLLRAHRSQSSRELAPYVVLTHSKGSLLMTAHGDGEQLVLAVCGESGDGRLGIGEAGHPGTAPSRGFVDVVTLMPWSLQAHTPRVKAMACGGYHNLVLTEDGGVYGWGANDEGQLGLESAGASIACPTRISFFDALRLAPSSPREVATPCGETVLEVACGGLHSLVRTTRGLYVTGHNAYGQLGLGDDCCDDRVCQWRRLCRLPLCLPADENDERGHDGETLPSASVGAFVVSRGEGAVCEALVQGEVTHMSAGTHHTLLAWKDCVVRRVVHSPPKDGTSTTTHVFYPILITACGKGDFGELGYDADPWAVLRSKDRRAHAAAITAASSQACGCQGVGGGAGGTRDSEGGHEAMASASSSAAPFYGFSQRWRPAAIRRPEFFSRCHRPVRRLAPVEAVAVVLDSSAETNREAAALRVKAALARLAHTDSAPPCAVRVAALGAAHLHSSVTLQTARVGGDGDDVVTWHWGCYYCNKVEDSSASLPRTAFSTSPSAALPAAAEAGELAASPPLPWRVHAGNEVLIRFLPSCDGSTPEHAASPTSPSPWAVLGSGNLGLGEEDSLEPCWVCLPLPFCRSARAISSHPSRCPPTACEPHGDASSVASMAWSTECVVGREHFLALFRRGSSDVDVKQDMVCGFGSNRDGELGLPAVSSTHSGAESQTTPVCLLRTGDCLSACQEGCSPAWYSVTRVVAIGAGVRHSVFLLRVRAVCQREVEPHQAL